MVSDLYDVMKPSKKFDDPIIILMKYHQDKNGIYYYQDDFGRIYKNKFILYNETL